MQQNDIIIDTNNTIDTNKLQKLFPHIYQTMLIASEYNGIVAGGFGRLLLLHSQNKLSDETFQDVMRWYHDVDFYFESTDDCERFIKDVQQSSKRYLDIDKTKYTYSWTTEYKYQCITSFVGNPVEILESFDLVNCMVAFKLNAPNKNSAFNKNVLYLHKDWQRYTDAKEIHVINWQSPLIFKRLEKYLNIQDHKLSQETMNALPHAVSMFFDDATFKVFDYNNDHKWSHDKLLYAAFKIIKDNHVQDVEKLFYLSTMFNFKYEYAPFKNTVNKAIFDKMLSLGTANLHQKTSGPHTSQYIMQPPV